MSEFDKSDCGGIAIQLCGARRAMIIDIQYQEIRTNKRRLNLAHLIERILDKEAKEYFKNKKI